VADSEALKQQACTRIDDLAGDLLRVSRAIHAHPELNYQEHYAHDLLVGELGRAGLEVTEGAYGVSTAFRSDVGRQGPRIALCLEYDALPEIGHACGHNIIAAAGLGAGLALAGAAQQGHGSVAILGTPAEEGGGGKIAMARRGAFDDVDAAMMVHPADADLVAMDTIAVQQATVSYHGRAAHAAAAPHEGRNALDAAVLGYVNVAALRQHIAPGERVHGIFTRGGDKPNIVPEYAEMLWYARSPTIAQLQELKPRLAACWEAGAVATGCRCQCDWDTHTYSDLRHNVPLAQAYVDNAARLGRQVLDPVSAGHRVVGSTDMGNVSYLVPAIHPMIAVAPAGVAIHTRDFAGWAASEAGDRAVLDGAKAMAMTTIDLWCHAELMAEVRASFGSAGPDRSVLAS
jgi:amidohydrolase